MRELLFLNGTRCEKLYFLRALSTITIESRRQIIFDQMFCCSLLRTLGFESDNE